MRLGDIDQRKHVVGLADLAGAAAVERAADRDQRAGRVVHRFDEAAASRR